MAKSKRIPELAHRGTLNTGAKLVFYDPASDTTYNINAEEIIPDVPNPDSLWSAGMVYNTGDIVTYAQTPDSDLEIWVSTEDDNEGNIPGPASTLWTLGNKYTAIGSIAPYEPKIYTGDNVYVTKIISGALIIYQLADPTRPFNSTDFATELSDGKWVAIGSGGGSAEIDRPIDLELTFDNSIGIVSERLTQTGDIEFTLASSGNIPLCTIVMPVTSDGAHKFIFPEGTDFISGMNNGDILPAGDFEFYFLYKGHNKISVSVPLPGIPTIPFFREYVRGTVPLNDNKKLTSDSDITGWDCKALLLKKIPAGQDGKIEVLLTSAAVYVMIALDADNTNGDQPGYSDKVWCNNPRYYTILGGGGATDSGVDAADGDILRMSRIGANFVTSYVRAGIEHVLTTSTAQTGDIHGHVWILSPSITVPVNS